MTDADRNKLSLANSWLKLHCMSDEIKKKKNNDNNNKEITSLHFCFVLGFFCIYICTSLV